MVNVTIDLWPDELPGAGQWPIGALVRIADEFCGLCQSEMP